MLGTGGKTVDSGVGLKVWLPDSWAVRSEVDLYYLNDAGQRVDLPTSRVRELTAGSDTAVLQRFDTSMLDEGYHVAGILVDINNDVPETSESNNSRETDLLIR